MSDYVLDASAVLAVLQEEPSSERIEPYLRTAPISAVNLAEVVTKLEERGFPDVAIDEMLQLLALDVRPFDADAGIAVGKLRSATRQAGLSLGDRACLTLAKQLGATALTTDRIWQELDLGIAVEVVR